MIDKKDKLLTLSSGKKYVVLEQCELNNNTYLFANEIIDDDTSENFRVFQMNIDNGEEVLTLIKDNNTIRMVSQLIDKKVNK